MKSSLHPLMTFVCPEGCDFWNLGLWSYCWETSFEQYVKYTMKIYETKYLSIHGIQLGFFFFFSVSWTDSDYFRATSTIHPRCAHSVFKGITHDRSKNSKWPLFHREFGIFWQISKWGKLVPPKPPLFFMNLRTFFMLHPYSQGIKDISLTFLRQLV